MILKLSKQASDDIVSILQYTYDTHGESQQQDYEMALNRALMQLTETPFIGRSAGSYRVWAVKKHLAYYLVQEDTVFIVRVLHERMDPKRHLSFSDSD